MSRKGGGCPNLSVCHDQLDEVCTMTRMLWVLLTLLIAQPSLARAPQEKHARILEPDRYLTAPQGKLAWMYAEGRRLVISDGQQGITAFDPTTGKVAWSHSAFGGRLDQAWGSAGRVVLAGTSLEVLEIEKGRSVWKRDTLCATGGTCNERVHDSSSSGVLISGQGRVHMQLQLHNLGRGKSVWKTPARVGHPRQVLARGNHVVSLDANAPFAIHFIDRRSGTVRGKWNQEKDGVPISPGDLRLLSDGSVVLVDMDVEPAVAEVTFVDLRGVKEGEWRITLPEGITTRPDWVEFVGSRIWISGPDEDGGRWIAQTRLGDGKPKLIVRGEHIDKPLRVADRIVMHRHDEGDLLLTAWEGGDARHLWSRTMIAPRRPATLHRIDERKVLAVLEDSPRALMIFDTFNGKVLAVGDLDRDLGEIYGAAYTGKMAFIQVKGGVQVMKASTLNTVVHKVRAEAVANNIEGARVHYERMALITPDAIPARDALQTLTMLRMARIEEMLLQGKKGVTSGMASLADLFTMPRHDGVTDLALLVRPIARVIGFHVFTDPKVPSVASAKALERIGESFATLVSRVGKHFSLGGREANREQALETATVIVASALIRARRAALGARILKAYKSLGKKAAPGQAALERRAAITSLVALIETHKKNLRDAKLKKRKAAMKHFAAFAFMKEALIDQTTYTRMLNKVAMEDSGLARRAGTEFINYLKRKVVRPANTELGPDLGEPACIAVCGALHETCSDSCPDIEACDGALKTCAKGCKRKLLWPRDVCE